MTDIIINNNTITKCMFEKIVRPEWMTQAKTAFTITLDSAYYKILIDISEKYHIKSRSAGITQALILSNAYMRLMDAQEENKKQKEVDAAVKKQMQDLKNAKVKK